MTHSPNPGTLLCCGMVLAPPSIPQVQNHPGRTENTANPKGLDRITEEAENTQGKGHRVMSHNQPPTGKTRSGDMEQTPTEEDCQTKPVWTCENENQDRAEMTYLNHADDPEPVEKNTMDYTDHLVKLKEYSNAMFSANTR